MFRNGQVKTHKNKGLVPCGGTIKINDLEDNSVSTVICWVTNGLQKTLALSLIMSKSA